jgi:hypothetical protein
MKYIYIITLLLIFPSLFAQNSNSEFMSSKNGDFENGVTGWTKGNTTHQISIDSSTDHVAPTGSTKSAKITLSNTTGSLAVIKHTQFTNQDLQNIRFSIWVKAAAENTTLRFRLNKQGYPKSRPITFLDTNWHKIVLTQYDATANSQSGIQIIGDDTTTPGAVFYIDDITASDGVLDSDFEIEAFGKFSSATAPIQVPVTQDPSANAIQHTWTASKIWTSQTHGTAGGGNGQNNVETYEYSSDEKAQGNRSLKVVTKSGAGDNALGIVQTRSNNTWDFRYKDNGTDQTVGGSDGTDNNGTVLYDKIQYNISYKIMSTSNAKHTANMKVNGTDNYVGVHNLVANQWKTITKTPVIDRSTLNPAKHTYPIFRFNSPSATYYIDDFQITWQETNDAILSSNEGEMEPLNIYPNPVEDFLVINNIFDRPQKIEIYSITGRILKSINLDSANNEVDVSSLNPGVYILKTEDSKTHKFIKK